MLILRKKNFIAVEIIRWTLNRKTIELKGNQYAADR
jgi:hypothetical protein